MGDTKASRQGIRAAAASAVAVSPNSTNDDGFLPPDCPVTPLGLFGNHCFYLDSQRQLIELPGRDHSRLGIVRLFNKNFHFLYASWPRTDKEGRVTGWRPELAAERLMASCGAKGIWNPADRERGRGAWRGERGELVLHTGQDVLTFAPNPRAWSDRLVHSPGVIGRFVYPAAEAVGMPADMIAGGAGDALLAMLRTWNWRRDDIDAVLLLGWMGAAMIGGALHWRPIVWITGGKSTGKSTLQDLIEAVFNEALIKLADTSEAYIRQTLKHQTLPVSLDEAESEEDNRRLNSIVRLARLAASGGKLGRGGSDHNAVEFTMRSAFQFGSILMPSLLGQDRSRMAVLELGELPKETPTPDVSRERWSPIGAQLRRRMVDGWVRWETTLAWYRHSKRAQDSFGTLLAAADVLLFDGAPNTQAGGEWIDLLRAAGMAEIEDDARDERQCADHLMSIAVDPFRNGSRRLLAEWVRIAALWDAGDAVQAQAVLGTMGLKVRYEKLGRDDVPMLVVADNHKGLADLFENTRWASRSGSIGVWAQALRRLPGADRAGAQYFAGLTCKATKIPLESVLVRRDPDAQTPLPGL
jgi:hypothetical protein